LAFVLSSEVPVNLALPSAMDKLPSLLARLTTLGATLHTLPDVPSIGRHLMRALRGLLVYDCLSLAWRTGEEAWIWQSTRPEDVPRHYTPAGLVGRVMETGEPLCLPTLADPADVESLSLPGGPPGTAGALILPLSGEDAVRGVLIFTTLRPALLSSESLAVGQLLALQVSNALHNVLLSEALDQSEGMIMALAMAIEARDPYTQGHCQRLSAYAARLGLALDVPPAELATLRKGGILHDIGKIAVSEHILLKTTPLTVEEIAEVQQHPLRGEAILRGALPGHGRLLLPIVRHHHECWDGTGYPDRLAGEAIPHLARIMAVVDAFDAMTTTRPYRRAMTVSQALEGLEAGAGSQFDPTMVSAFVQMVREGRLVVE